jgi:hypothetical protein
VNPKDFHDLVGDDVTGEEAERLRRVHDLLVQAGPPPELSPALSQPPAPNVRRLRPRRRLEAVLVLAAALLAAAFGAGYLVGDRGHGSNFVAKRVIVMHGVAAPQAFMSLQVGAKDSAGNWPLLAVAQGLPKLRQGDFYELYLSWHGRPVSFCGYFAVHDGRTTVRMNAPFPRKRFDGWIVLKNGQKPDSAPQLST